jgi:hypothetical protein
MQIARAWENQEGRDFKNRKRLEKSKTEKKQKEKIEHSRSQKNESKKRETTISKDDNE